MSKQQKNLRERRLLWPPKIKNKDNLFVLPTDPKFNLRKQILNWIDSNTSGQFYIGPNILYFCDDKDATAYILCNAYEKCKEKI